MGTIKTTNIETITGSGTLTLGQSGETINVPSGATLNMSNGTMTLNSSMKNTPSFAARRNSNQSISNNTETKIAYDQEVFDTDSAYDNSTNYRFTPQTAGKYLITAGFRLNPFTSGRAVIWIRKNGSTDHGIDEKYGDSSGTTQSALSAVIIDMNGSSDYVEAYCYQGSGSSKNLQGSPTNFDATFFQGFKLIGV